MLNSDISLTCTHNMTNFGPLAADFGERRRCSNEANTRNPLKFAGVPQTPDEFGSR